MTQEQWRPVVGFEEYYSVSSEGRLRRDAPGRSTSQGRMLEPYVDRRGYKATTLSGGGRKSHEYVHSIVAMAFADMVVGEGEFVRHRNGDRSDNRVENLGRAPVRNHCQRRGKKLERQDARRIRELYDKKEDTLLGVAEAFGVSRGHVSDVVRGLVWASAGGPIQKGRLGLKLSDQDVAEIRELRASGLLLAQIAERFGVDQSTISRIVNFDRRDNRQKT